MSADLDDSFETPREMLGTARAAYRDGRYEDALSALDSGLPEWRERRDVGLFARDCYLAMGELSRALGEINRVLINHDDDSLRHQARFQLGKLRETDPSWLPPVGRTRRQEATPSTVLHILKESLPYSETGFTFRSRMTLTAHLRAGWNPVVVTSLGFPRGKGVEQFPEVQKVDGVVHHRLDVDPGTDVRRMPYDIAVSTQARLSARVAEDVRPALVQAGTGFRGFDTALVGLAVARAADTPFVYEVRGFQEQTWTSDVSRSERGEYYARRRSQELRCLKAADCVITIAEAMRDEIIDRGIDPDLVHVVPNAVDVDRFVPRSRREDLVAEHGLQDHRVIGYISNLGWREGLQYLVEATALLVQAKQSVKCLIVGDGPEREALLSLARERGVDDNVVLTGHVPNHEIEDYYALIDVFVVPRVNDRASRLVTPLKPLEAMAMGVPVVVSDLPALRELAQPGERGTVFGPEDASDLAGVVRDLLDDDSARRKYADNARTWILNERTLESNVARYERALGSYL